MSVAWDLPFRRSEAWSGCKQSFPGGRQPKLAGYSFQHRPHAHHCSFLLQRASSSADLSLRLHLLGSANHCLPLRWACRAGSLSVGMARSSENEERKWAAVVREWWVQIQRVVLWEAGRLDSSEAAAAGIRYGSYAKTTFCNSSVGSQSQSLEHIHHSLLHARKTASRIAGCDRP
jgi:hypothetical protein